jgi:hypothetical protein
MMRHGLVLVARFRRQNGPWRVPCGYALGGCHYDTNVNHDASPKRRYNRVIAAVGMLEIRKLGRGTVSCQSPESPESPLVLGTKVSFILDRKRSNLHNGHCDVFFSFPLLSVLHIRSRRSTDLGVVRSSRSNCKAD